MFYVKPPIQRVPLYVVESCVFTRLDYLHFLYYENTVRFTGKFEYLLENSLYDKVGHFTLRLLAATSGELQTLWIKREVLLLKYRLSHTSTRQLYRLLTRTISELNAIANKTTIINHLIDFYKFFLSPIIFQHTTKDHAGNCKMFSYKVRFELVPNLVKARQVDLTAGYAIIFCSQWIEVFEELFHTYLNEELKNMTEHGEYIVNNDHRLCLLRSKILSHIGNAHQKSKVTVECVDKEVKNFPMCMQHLYGVLHQRHRLSHYARLYYSLFLKEIGMEIHEAIKYWRGHYLKPYSCGSTCSHNWPKDQRKFVYSIRHLYGLEGSRRNYSAPNCSVIYNHIPGPNYEGGCPFVNFDKTMLERLLNNVMTKENVTHFLEDIKFLKPEVACSTLLNTLQKINNDSCITSPLQYYLLIKKH